LLLELFQLLVVAAGDDKVVDVHTDDEAVLAGATEVDGMLGGATMEAKGDEG
jgi:hypothetical protein